jgi:hypothetical protein
MTTDLQRMHQDEWLGALRGGYTQHIGHLFPRDAGGNLQPGTTACALGVCIHATQLTVASEYEYDDALMEWLGVSCPFLSEVVHRNDKRLHSFAEIADWVKEQRDAWDGDLSDWWPAA